MIALLIEASILKFLDKNTDNIAINVSLAPVTSIGLTFFTLKYFKFSFFS